MTKSKAIKKAPKAKARRSVGFIETKILSVLREYHQLEIACPHRIEVALMCGFRCVGGTESFSAAMTSLKGAGYVSYPGNGTVCLTDAGIARVGSVSEPHTIESFQARIRKLLGKTATKIFDQLLDGLARSREELAAEVGFTSVRTKSFSDSLNKMKTLKLLEYATEETHPERKLVRLSDKAFPRGRPIH